MGVVLDLHQVPALFKVRHDVLPALEALLAAVLAAVLVDVALFVEHLQDGQVMPLAHLEVVGVVGGRDLHRASAELHLAVFVAHDGDLPVHQGQDHRLADDGLIPLVLGVHRDGCIAQHGLGSGGGHGDGIGLVGSVVADMPEMALLGLILHLGVGQGGLAVGAPVDDPITPIDELLVVQGFEHLDHGLVAALVHGEPLPLPVAGGAHLPKLLHDGGAVLFPPLPGALQKTLPANILLGETLLRQGFHDLHLGGDGGVVGPREP